MRKADLRLAINERQQVLSASASVETLLGYEPAELISNAVSLTSLIHRGDAEVAAELLSANAKEPREDVNLRMRHADGRVRCLRAHCEAEAQKGGQTVLHLTLTDAREPREESKKQTAVSLGSVMESVDEGVYFKDRNHVILLANRNYCLMFSNAADPSSDVVGHTDYDLFPEEIADEAYRIEELLLSGAPMVHLVQKAVSKEGIAEWFDFRCFPVRDENGHVIGVFGTLSRITEGLLAERALRESEASLKQAQRIAGLGSYVLDIPAGVWTSSETHDELYGIDRGYPHTVEGWRELIYRDDRDRMSHHLKEVVQGRDLEFSMEYRIVRVSDGAMRWVHALGRIEKDAQGNARTLRGTIQDITARKASEERLQLAASVFTHASEGITITDASGTILDVNDAFTRITGYMREEVLGKNPRLLNSGRQNREFYADMWTNLLEKGHWSGEIWNRAKSGQIYAEMLTITAVPDANGNTKQYVAMFSDITSIKEQERQLEHVAQYDLLTGLPNRVLLADRLRQAMAQAHRSGRTVAVACLDLDNFRAINDQHGHNTGDQLLTAITHRMSLALREGDTLARLGGDELVAVMLDLGSQDDSQPLISSLLNAAAEQVELGELTLHVSASIGVTFYPQAEDVDADQLLRQADQAMYHAKTAGKDRFHIFDATVDRSMRGHLEDLERIREALKKGEFVLHYQPKVNMSTGTILGTEALIRWQHPEKGLLPPAQFLPILAENPLIIELGEWVIERALQQMEQWREDGLDISVSVNVDALQLQQPEFVERLFAILSRHPDIPPSRFELEVLESGALRDVAQVSQVIRACTQLGVSFALDDFGTGYSSLSYLKRLPVHFLKIDQTFVHDMLDDPEDLTILEGVLGLASAFRREAVAEGVETVEHGVMLLRLGCQLAQGYGIARPMPGSELRAWAAHWRPNPRWVTASPVDPVNRPLLYADVEHRAWVTAIQDFLQGHLLAPPTMDQHLCRFGSWLDAEASAGRGGRSGFQTIDALHKRLHQCGEGILAQKGDGTDEKEEAALERLRNLRDELAMNLQFFVQAV